MTERAINSETQTRWKERILKMDKGRFRRIISDYRPTNHRDVDGPRKDGTICSSDEGVHAKESVNVDY